MGILNKTTISSNQQTEKEPLDGNTTQDKIDPSIYDRLKDVQIVFIKEIINPKLYKKFFLNGMTNIKSILDTRVIEFLAKPSIGKTRGIIKSCGRRKFENEVPYAKIKFGKFKNLTHRRHTAHERFYQKLH
jgi:hypothetical protein